MERQQRETEADKQLRLFWVLTFFILIKFTPHYGCIKYVVELD